MILANHAAAVDRHVRIGDAFRGLSGGSAPARGGQLRGAMLSGSEMQRVLRRMWALCCSLSLLLVLVVVVFWIRGYWAIDSVSYWGHSRYELWSQTGKFGYYKSATQRPDLPPVTWATLEVKASWSSPSLGGSVQLIQPDRRIFKWFKFRSVNGYPEIEVPAWALALLLLIAPVIWLVPWYRRWRRIRAGCCVVCGYDLRASHDSCPECGNQLTATGK